METVSKISSYKIFGNCCVVYGSVSSLSQDGCRTPRSLLINTDDPWIQITENKITYEFDVTKSMFAKGNGTERIRMADIGCSGEIVVDLFCGIGYFTLPLLVHAKACHVHACDWNPHALIALRRNVDANRVFDRCTVYEGDCREVAPRNCADRVILGLIPTSRLGWPVALSALRATAGGVLHIHDNVDSKEVPPDFDSLRCVCGRRFSTKGAETDSPQTDSPETDSIKADEYNCFESSSDSGGKETTAKQTIAAQQIAAPESSAQSFCQCIVHKFHRPVANRRRQLCWSAAALRTMRQLGGIAADKWTFDLLAVVKVKEYAPHVTHLVFDIRANPAKSD